MTPSCTELKLKWIKELNVEMETFNLIENKKAKTTEVIGISKDFLNRTPVEQEITLRNNKQGYIKLKTSVYPKKQPMAQEKQITSYFSED